jgi:hypothetical protein
MSDDVTPMPPEELGGDEGWTRLTDEPHVRGVEVISYPDDDDEGRRNWQVGLWVAEYVREEPLESRLRSAMEAALRAVPGVQGVAEEDREVWFVSGAPSGRALAEAAAAAVDGLADELRAAYFPDGPPG